METQAEKKYVETMPTYYDSLKEREMYCPLCKTLLNVGEWFTYNDVCGNSRSPKFECDNIACELSINESFWNDSGDFFSGKLDINRSWELFPTQNFAAFNSFAKSTEISIYKRGLPQKKYLSPVLCLGFLKPFIEYTYESDSWGNITKRGCKLKFLKKNENGEYIIHYISGIKMFFFMMERFKSDLKGYKNNKSDRNKKEIASYFNETWDTRGYKKFFRWFISTFYYKVKKEVS